jgi:hypothetical protein
MFLANVTTILLAAQDIVGSLVRADPSILVEDPIGHYRLSDEFLRKLAENTVKTLGGGKVQKIDFDGQVYWCEYVHSDKRKRHSGFPSRKEPKLLLEIIRLRAEIRASAERTRSLEKSMQLRHEDPEITRKLHQEIQCALQRERWDQRARLLLQGYLLGKSYAAVERNRTLQGEKNRVLRYMTVRAMMRMKLQEKPGAGLEEKEAMEEKLKAWFGEGMACWNG